MSRLPRGEEESDRLSKTWVGRQLRGDRTSNEVSYLEGQGKCQAK